MQIFVDRLLLQLFSLPFESNNVTVRLCSRAKKRFLSPFFVALLAIKTPLISILNASKTCDLISLQTVHMYS